MRRVSEMWRKRKKLLWQRTKPGPREKVYTREKFSTIDHGSILDNWMTDVKFGVCCHFVLKLYSVFSPLY